MSIILLLVPLFWTGSGPIPYPDCVEIVDNNTVKLHSDFSVRGCGLQELLENSQYYTSRGYNKTQSDMEPSDRPGFLTGEGTMTFEKMK